MNSLVNKKTQGFTIIEVVLVLAIAGLIFLVVFLALPALQRSQRDTQRKNDLSRFMSQVTTYQSNTQGNLPGTSVSSWNTFISNYLSNSGQSFTDPQGRNYEVVSYSSSPQDVGSLSAGDIKIYTGSRCSGNGVQANAGARNFAAVIFVEQGGFFCQNN